MAGSGLLAGRGSESSALNRTAGGKNAASPVTSIHALTRLTALEVTTARSNSRARVLNAASTLGSGCRVARRCAVTARFSASTHRSNSSAVKMVGLQHSPLGRGGWAAESKPRSTQTPLALASATAVERKFNPVVLIRNSSAEYCRSTPQAARNPFVTLAEATNAGSSEGNRLPSASHKTARTGTLPQAVRFVATNGAP